MQLNMTTDYAMRMILVLGDGQVRTIEETAQQSGIPRHYMGKIVRKLKDAGMVRSNQGVRGGIYLEKALEDITVLEVFSVMEPTVKINRCLEPDACCSQGKADSCPVRGYYQYIQNKLEKEYFSVSLKQIQDGDFPAEEGAGTAFSSKEKRIMSSETEVERL